MITENSILELPLLSTKKSLRQITYDGKACCIPFPVTPTLEESDQNSPLENDTLHNMGSVDYLSVFVSSSDR